MTAIPDIIEKIANNTKLTFDERRELENWFQTVEEMQSLFAEVWHVFNSPTAIDLGSPSKVVVTNENRRVTTDPHIGYFARTLVIGSQLGTNTVNATSSSGIQITGLTIGDWYAIEGTGGPWHAGGSPPLSGNYYTFDLSLDGLTWDGPIGFTNTDQVMHLDLPDFVYSGEAVDAHYGRIYFQATTTSVWFRVSDSSYGDNSGTLGYKLYSAVYGESRITFDDVEYTQAKLPSAIHAATEKTTPVDADEFPLWDSVVSLLKKVTWANIKATLQTYFDTVYPLVGGLQIVMQPDLTDPPVPVLTPEGDDYVYYEI